MKPLIAQTLRSRWLAGLIHAGLWLLLYLATRSLEGTAPAFRDQATAAPPARIPSPVAKLERFFVANTWPDITVGSNSVSAFATRHFIPPPAPAPPAPTTRKIDLTYQGFYFTEEGSKHVMVKMGEAFLVVPEGTKLTANLHAAQAAVMSLILTNDAGGTNLLPLNKQQDVEIPIK